MEDRLLHISNSELLGRVLDGVASPKERKMVLLSMIDPVFEERFMVALRATMLNNPREEAYETNN